MPAGLGVSGAILLAVAACAAAEEVAKASPPLLPHLTCFDGDTPSGVCDGGRFRFDTAALRGELLRRMAGLTRLHVAVVGAEADAAAMVLNASVEAIGGQRVAAPPATTAGRRSTAGVPTSMGGSPPPTTCVASRDPVLLRAVADATAVAPAGAASAAGSATTNTPTPAAPRPDNVTFCFSLHPLVGPTAAAASIAVAKVDAAVLVRPAARYLLRDAPASSASPAAPGAAGPPGATPAAGGRGGAGKDGWYSWLTSWVGGGQNGPSVRINMQAVQATADFFDRLSVQVHPVLVVTDLEAVRPRKALGRLQQALRRAMPEVLFIGPPETPPQVNAHPQVYREAVVPTGDTGASAAAAGVPAMLQRSYTALMLRKVLQQREPVHEVALHLRAAHAARDALERRRALPDAPHYAWALAGLHAARKDDLTQLQSDGARRDLYTIAYAVLALVLAAGLLRGAYIVAKPLSAGKKPAPASAPAPAAAPKQKQAEAHNDDDEDGTGARGQRRRSAVSGGGGSNTAPPNDTNTPGEGEAVALLRGEGVARTSSTGELSASRRSDGRGSNAEDASAGGSQLVLTSPLDTTAAEVGGGGDSVAAPSVPDTSASTASAAVAARGLSRSDEASAQMTRRRGTGELDATSATLPAGAAPTE